MERDSFSAAVTVPTEYSIKVDSEYVLSTDSVIRVRIFASIMSSASIIGAMFIIVSYILFKSIRTKAREILFHLSLADFGVGLTNLIGAIVNYSSIIYKYENNSSSVSLILPFNAYVDLCKVQAFFAQYFTLASILWTLVLAFYVYILVLENRHIISLWIVRFGYLISWGLPLLVSLWFVFTGKLGATRLGSGGWCSLRVESKHGNIQYLTVLFGSDLWVMFTFILILVLYTTSHYHLRLKVNEMKKKYNIDGLSQNSDTKFLAIPFCFLLLRLGSVVMSILIVYTRAWENMGNVPHKIIFYWMAIGDSSEGIVNGIIFCFLTPRIRQQICCCCSRKKGSVPTAPNETEEQRRLLDNPDVSIRYSTNRVLSSHSSLSSSVSDTSYDTS